MMAVKQAKSSVGTGRARAGAFRRIIQFLLDAWSELNKVAWPTLVDVRKFTLVVIFAVTVVAVFIHMSDALLSILTRPLFIR